MCSKIGKTPIVVNDSRGFYTSRCFSTYVDEGAIMLAEGIAPAIIDNVGRMTGMPRGPLEVSDDVALDLQLRILEQTKRDLGEAYKPSATDTLLELSRRESTAASGARTARASTIISKAARSACGRA